MWPKLTNINSDIVTNVKSKSDNLKASELNAWIRVFSGATSKNSNGLILSSGNSYGILKAAGQSSSYYGDATTTGVVGVNWKGTPIAAGDRGLRPSTLITGFSVKEGKDQISREATLQLKCFSLKQMEVVQKYFLEPGYSLCIEWGWNTDIAGTKLIKIVTDKGEPQPVSEILNQAAERNLDFNKLTELRVNSFGDYDSFLGFIVGGNVSNDGEAFNVDVKLRGQPGLPTYLQSQFEVKNLDDDGKTPSTKIEPYVIDKTESESFTVDYANNRRYKSMFNNLATVRQNEAVKTHLSSNKTKYTDFINFDDFVAETLIKFRNDKTFFGNAEESNLNGVLIKNEDLLSDEKFIKFDLAIEILNKNGSLEEYKIGNKKVGVNIDISNTKIGAFPNMFSTDATKLIIPNTKLPDFAWYFLSKETIIQKTNGILSVNGVDKPTINSPIGGVSFVQHTNDLNEDGFSESKGYWGYLKDLYINFNVFNQSLNQRNINKREALVYILNQITAAVNSFWNFQIVESQADSDNNITISVIDENWIGKHPDEPGIVTFEHIGPNSPFLSTNLDISIPSEMANQIIGERLGKAVNPDQKILNINGKNSFFSSDTDLFLQKVSNTNGGAGTNDSNENDEAEKEKRIAQIKAERDVLEAELNSKIDPTKTQTSRYGTKGSSGSSEAYYDKNGKLLKSITTTSSAAGSSTYTSFGEEYKDRINEFDKKLSSEGTSWQEVNEEAKEKQAAAYTENIKKLDLLPLPIIYTKIGEIEKKLTDEKWMHQYLCSYTFNDPSYFDKLKNDSMRIDRPGTLSHPLPIKYTFTVLGNSGFQRGDTFNIIGIPSKYREKGLFQITQVEHTLDGMQWKTTVTGEYRCSN